MSTNLFKDIVAPPDKKVRKKRPKQVTEGYFRAGVIQLENILFHRIQNLGHVKTPGDFYVWGSKRCFLIECKQVTDKDVFYFSRLTQLNFLLNFDSIHAKNRSYVLLCFWYGSKKKSHTFMVDISAINNLILSGSKGITVEELERTFKAYRVYVSDKGNWWDLAGYFW